MRLSNKLSDSANKQLLAGAPRGILMLDKELAGRAFTALAAGLPA
jgi:hypothetical protein